MTTGVTWRKLCEYSSSLQKTWKPESENYQFALDYTVDHSPDFYVKAELYRLSF